VLDNGRIAAWQQDGDRARLLGAPWSPGAGPRSTPATFV